MQQVVNFLPWRRDLRRRSARRWAAIWLITALAVAALGVACQWRAAPAFYHAALWQHSDETIAAALAAAEKPLQLRHQQWQQAQARLLRRQNTGAWRETLLALAESLPAQAWLTELRWQQNRLELSGLAGTFGALSALERQLQTMAGFRVQPGATARDAQGRWRFHYLLTRESDDAKP